MTKGTTSWSCVLALAMAGKVWAGQAPLGVSAADIPVSHRDRVYAAEQFSNTVSVTDPADNRLLGVIRLGDPTPGNLSPLYRGQLLVHGMGFSPDHHTLAVVSIGSNSVTFIDTESNSVKHTTYVGRSPHEAFFTPDGKEVWVTVRGENYVAILDSATFLEKSRLTLPNGPGMTIFAPDGSYAYVCSSFSPQTTVFSVAEQRVVGQVSQPSPFCPDIAATPDGKQVWLTLKDRGKVLVFAARPPFQVLETLDTGPITNHVNFAGTKRGTFAYVTVGGRNEVQVYRTTDFQLVGRIPTGRLPHGIWPSGDGSRMYVGLENDDALAVIDTLSNQVVANVPIGQAPQAVVYVPDAVATGDGRSGLVPLGVAAGITHVTLQAAPGSAHAPAAAASSVALFDQGLLQVMQLSATQLQAGQPYVLAMATQSDGTGLLEPLSSFVASPAGAALASAVGPIRQLLQGAGPAPRRYLVIVAGTPADHGAPVQIQSE